MMRFPPLVILISIYLAFVGCGRLETHEGTVTDKIEIINSQKVRKLLSTSSNYQTIRCIKLGDEEDLVRLKLREVFLEFQETDFPGDFSTFECYFQKAETLSGESDILTFDTSISVFGKLIGIDEFQLKELLMDGRVQITDRSNNQYLKSYFVAEYSHNEARGLVFLFPDRSRLILEVQDYVY